MNVIDNSLSGYPQTSKVFLSDGLGTFSIPQFYRWIPWVMLAADLIALSLSMLFGYSLRIAMNRWIPIGLSPEYYIHLFLGVLLIPLGYAWVGLYPGYGLGAVERLRLKSNVTLLLFILLIAWEYLIIRQNWSRGVLLATMVFALILIPSTGALVRHGLIRLGCWGTPAVILGTTPTGALLARLLKQSPELGFRPVAFLDNNPGKWDQQVEAVPVLGPLSQSQPLAHSGVSLAIIAMPDTSREGILEIVEQLPFQRIIMIPDLFGIPSLLVSTLDIEGVLGLELRKRLLIGRNRILKRVLDLLVGIPLLLLSLPLMGICILLIKQANPGPAFFSQEREGLYGKPIRIIKLRTMYLDAEERLQRYLAVNAEAQQAWERFFKLKNDPRIIAGIGHFLRKTSIDELPQLWQIVIGELSLVGPRPFPHYHLDKFRLPFRELRRSVRPGVTGLWQVSARSAGDLEIQEALDTYYIRNWSIWLDIHILLRTMWVVLSGKGAY